MNPAKNAPSNELLIKRLQAMRMSASDIASAEASLRNADAIVDVGFGIATAIRSAAAYVACHVSCSTGRRPSHDA